MDTTLDSEDCLCCKRFGRAPPRLARADFGCSPTRTYYCTVKSYTHPFLLFAEDASYSDGCGFFSFRRSKTTFRGMAAVQVQRGGDAALTGPYTLRTLLYDVPLSAEGENVDSVITCVEYWGL